MRTLPYPVHTKRSPLQQAKTRERVATYAIALIVGLVMVLVVRAFMVAGSESPAAQDRIMNAIVPLAQLIVSFATLALVRYHMSVAVRDIEQAEQTANRLQYLTESVYAMQELLRNASRPASAGTSATMRTPRSGHPGVSSA